PGHSRGVTPTPTWARPCAQPLRLRGRPFRLVWANSLNCRSLMLSAIWREAPLRLCFERSPRLAASAAPAAICCFFDLAGMTLLLATSPGTSRRDILMATMRECGRFRPGEADGRVLSRRRLDRRRAIPSPLRQALVEPALVKHGIGEPNAAAH